MCYQNFKIYSRNCCLAFWSFSVGLKDATCASGSFYLLLPIAKQLCLLWLQFPKKFVKLIFTANQIFDLSANSPCQITKERLWQLWAALCSCNKCHFMIVPERIYFKRSISSHWRFSSVCCLSQFFFSYWSTCVGDLAAAILSILVLETQNVTFQICKTTQVLLDTVDSLNRLQRGLWMWLHWDWINTNLLFVLFQESGDDEYHGEHSDTEDEVDSDFDIDEGDEPDSDQEEDAPRRKSRVVTKAYKVETIRRSRILPVC